MKSLRTIHMLVAGFAVAGVLALAVPPPALAHCDTLDGPIVPEAQSALESGRIDPILKWVQAEDEEEIREAFAQARSIRGIGPEVRRMADRYFLETLIRIHREGEGAPYTGLKPAGTIDPGIAAADAAIASGSVDGLADAVAAAIHDAIHEKFAVVNARRAHAGHNVDAGREYVESYVEYIHFIEGLQAYAGSKGEDGSAPACGGHAR